jgi:hypothetical protein
MMNPAPVAGSASACIAATMGQLYGSAVVAKLDKHETDLESLKSDLKELAWDHDKVVWQGNNYQEKCCAWNQAPSLMPAASLINHWMWPIILCDHKVLYSVMQQVHYLIGTHAYSV